MSDPTNKQMLAALLEFVDTIENTGGVYATRKGYVPAADVDWSDLGEAYMTACEALGREPKEQVYAD